MHKEEQLCISVLREEIAVMPGNFSRLVQGMIYRTNMAIILCIKQLHLDAMI